jgi:DNA-binding Lrp family transcriptional regulator
MTRNERKTLKLLLADSSISDTDIASRLHITSQAVGKIRRKLESTVIKKYSVELDYARLGIETFAIALAKMTDQGMERGELEVEQQLLDNPHIISVYRVPKASTTHIILYGFRDMNELDEFFHSSLQKKELHSLVETRELFSFSHNSLVKNSPMMLFHKVMDAVDNSQDVKFRELEKFKKRLS